MEDWRIEAWNMIVRIGASSALKSFRKRACIPSGPAALEASKFCISSTTPFTLIDRSDMSGMGESSNDGDDDDDIGVKTEIK